MLSTHSTKIALCAIALIVFGILPNSMVAQNSHGKEFHRLFHQADSLYDLGQYTAAGQLCDQALEMKGGQFPDSGYYRHGFSYWTEAGNLERSIFYLERALLLRWQPQEILESLENDPEYEFLRQHERFREIMDTNYTRREKYSGIADTLHQIKVKDQTLRQLLSCAREKFADDSLQLNAYYDLMEMQDSFNLIYVASVLDAHGWLAINKIGEPANRALWQVIQHSPLEVQEKYLPLLRESAEKGESRMSSYAFLQDRVLMRRGQRQRYGTQITKHPDTGKSAVYPVEDPIHIDSIRASVGFEPIKEYAAFFDIEITSPADLDDQRVLEDWQERRKKNN